MNRHCPTEAQGAARLSYGARALPGIAQAPLPDTARSQTILVAPAGKKARVGLNCRPFNCESPIDYLKTAITPNEAFFVRYNLPDLPLIDADCWRLTVGGPGARRSIELDLDDLKRLPAVEVIAVCQCSGNRRRFFRSPAPGLQWGHGAVGCARWKGARLKDVLDLAGLNSAALEIVLDGADRAADDGTPDFIKSLPVWKAIEDTTLVAYEMNGEPLPDLHGSPARLVVPGWAATYWVKHLISIAVAVARFDGHWMLSAYRLPHGRFPTAARFGSQENDADAPITEMMVNTLITSPSDGAAMKAGEDVIVAGVAWDGGYGIGSVEVSSDRGKTWTAAQLADDPLGPFAFRSWSCRIALARRGRHLVMARATNAIGQSQPAYPIPNRGGYLHNAVQAIALVAR